MNKEEQYADKNIKNDRIPFLQYKRNAIFIKNKIENMLKMFFLNEVFMGI